MVSVYLQIYIYFITFEKSFCLMFLIPIEKVISNSKENDIKLIFANVKKIIMLHIIYINIII